MSNILYKVKHKLYIVDCIRIHGTMLHHTIYCELDNIYHGLYIMLDAWRYTVYYTVQTMHNLHSKLLVVYMICYALCTYNSISHALAMI